MITVDFNAYSEMVGITAEALGRHDIGPRTRVLVAHAFDPWAIGSVFRDAALECGACVLPMGLLCGESAMWQVVRSFRPNAICVGASLLLSWMQKNGSLQGLRTVLHAGEGLLQATRDALVGLCGAKVIDIYGMAEFGTLAVECPTGKGLVLCPHFDFALRHQGRTCEMWLGSEGEMGVRRTRSGRWCWTGDLVRVEEAAASGSLWTGQPTIRLLGRCDQTVSLPDGGKVAWRQVVAAIRSCGVLQSAQLIIRRHDGVAFAEYLCVGNHSRPVNVKAMRQALLQHCVELADSVRFGATMLTVRQVAESDLRRTLRGKIPVLRSESE